MIRVFDNFKKLHLMIYGTMFACKSFKGLGERKHWIPFFVTDCLDNPCMKQLTWGTSGP